MTASGCDKMKKIGIMTAMDKELELFSGFINFENSQTIHKRIFLSGNNGHNDITAVVSGIGKVNAALCASNLIEKFNVDMIINIGISGSLTNKLNIGDFIVGNKIVYHDVWCGHPNKIGQIQDLPESFCSDKALCNLLPELKHGTICCGDIFVDNQQTLNDIVTKFPEALAVDMESAAIAQTCYLYNVPLLSIRQISDTPGIEHHAEQYAAFWNNAPHNSSKLIKQLLEKI